MKRNSKENIKEWARKAIREGYYMDEDEQRFLLIEAMKIIDEGGWRGDVSDHWRQFGYTTVQIPDLY